MKRFFFICFVLFTVLTVCGQNKRALVIGINTYMPPQGVAIGGNRSEYKDLEGCKNDAMSVRSLIRTKYHFEPENIDSLWNQDATREHILSKLSLLLNKCAKGDIAFIYYAGHGSQQRNSLSKEADGKDESIVPADTWKAGVGDIRDKELAKIFNAFIDKGVKLTVILDCCHSGSMSRGNPPANYVSRQRYIASNNYDAKDASDPVAPEARPGNDFLIISGAQDNEFADEQVDDYGQKHGAFTLALIAAINQQPVDASVLNIFKSVGVILKSNGKSQEPVLAGSEERQGQTLFGIDKGKLTNKLLIPVYGVKNGLVLLEGGFAEGLYEGHELTSATDSSVVVRIEKVRGISFSQAEVVKGDISKIKEGELFEISNWVSSNAPLIKIFVPESPFSAVQVSKIAVIATKIRTAKAGKWISDFEKADPEISAYFDGSKLFMNRAGKMPEEIMNTDADNLLKLSGSATLFFNLPPAQELVNAIKNAFKVNNSIAIVTKAADANYILYGTLSADGKPAYGLLRNQAASKDSLGVMPLQTRNIALTTNDPDGYSLVAANIFELAKRLAKVRAWLTLKAPEDNKDIFPFHLEFRYQSTGKSIVASTAKIGEKLALYLAADSGIEVSAIPRKYIYIFTIDKNGKMQLAFPRGTQGNIDNKFPQDEKTTIYDMNIKFRVSIPTGIDNFYLLASETPIPGYAALFNQQGARGPVNRTGTDHPLFNVLDIGNDESIGATRGDPFEAPQNWNLIRALLKTTY